MKIISSILIAFVAAQGKNSGDNMSNYGGGSTGYGDPHFHILGINETQLRSLKLFKFSGETKS